MANGFTPHELAKLWLEDCVVVGTETTGLSEVDEILEVAVVDANGVVLLNTLVRPSICVPNEATTFHGISDTMLLGSPSWRELHAHIFALLQSKRAVAFNAEFAHRMLLQTTMKHGLEFPEVHIGCAMTAYAKYYGEWNERHGTWSLQSLADALLQLGVSVEDHGHRALPECRRTLALLGAMASRPVYRPRFSEELEDLSRRRAALSFGELVDACTEYARFSGWNSSRSAAIGRAEAWLRQSIGWAGEALEWKRTGIDGLAEWKRTRQLLPSRIGRMSADALREALQAGGDVDERNVSGETSLIAAVKQNPDISLVMALIDQGAELGARDVTGATALHYSALCSPECVDLLITAGADVHALSVEGASPLCYALQSGNEGAIESLFRAGADQVGSPGKPQPLHFAARYSPNSIARLIAAGAGPNGLDDKRRTPLHWAILSYREKIALLSIAALMKAGANPELKDADGNTVLVAALKSQMPGLTSVVESLLAFGASVRYANKYGTTPLHFAAKYAQSSVVITALLRAGADQGAIDKRGMSPRDYATARGSTIWPEP